MGFGLPPLVAVGLATLTSSTPPRAIYSSAVPMCDALGLSDEDSDAAARDGVPAAEEAITLAVPNVPPGAQAALPVPLTLASYARACSAPATPATALACIDVRASLWVNRMSTSCTASGAARPRPPAVALRAARDRGRDAVACVGPDCYRDPIPLRAVSRSDEGRSFLVLARLHFPFCFEEQPVFEAPRLPPQSPPPRRLLRPPRA